MTESWHDGDPMKYLVLFMTMHLATPVVEARPWSDDVIYFALTDRFHDGDASNNIPPGCDPALYDPQQKNLNCYHGGDLRGLEKALVSGYFRALGVTALWITPPVKNSWRSGFDLGGWKSGYHGYWAQDFLDIDPHLTSRTALDGSPYADTPEGRMQHYRDFVRLAHAQGIKVIQDVVINHVGPLFYYDTNGNGTFEFDREDEWVRPFKREGFYDTARWAEIPKWNLAKAEPSGPVQLLGRSIATKGVLADLSMYSRKGFNWDSLGASDGQEMVCDFFSLRDFWTGHLGSNSFEALTDEFAEIYAFYLDTVGVDGLRIDTVKHVHQEFWDVFTTKLRAKLGAKAKDKIIFGEVFDGNPARLGQYTYRTDWPQQKGPSLDSVLNFRFCFTARDYLRRTGASYGSAHSLEKSQREMRANDPQGRPFYNLTAGQDGLDAVQKSITFIENHDGINRFRVKDVSEEKHMLAQALVLLSEGIPCLYYGAEIALQDPIGEVGQDAESGRLTLFPANDGQRVTQAKNSAVFQQMRTLIQYRAAHPVLRTGLTTSLWCDSGEGKEDDGIFAMARYFRKNEMIDQSSTTIVVFNASMQESATMSGKHALRLYAGKQALAPVGSVFQGKVVYGKGVVKDVSVEANGRAVFACPAQSVVVYSLKQP